MQPLGKVPEFDEYIRRWPVKIDGKALKAVVETYFPKQRSECVVFGRRCVVPRDEVMFTEKPDHETYTYSNHEVSLILKRYDNKQTRLRAKSWINQSISYKCYGRDGVGWHRDDEPTVDQTFPIVSFSFGDTRDFIVRRDTDGLTFGRGRGGDDAWNPRKIYAFGANRTAFTFRVYKKEKNV